MTVKLIATGGSIAEIFEGAGVRHLTGADLADELTEGSIGPEVEVTDLMSVPSTWISPEDMWHIGEEIRRSLSTSSVVGAVVSHGTATLEESAFWADLVIDGDKPVVFTGAQRYPDMPGYDGIRNLKDAISVAAAPGSLGLGSLVVMDGQIHAARDVVKAHPTSMAAFQSPAWGPIGMTYLGSVHYSRMPLHRYPQLAPRLPLPRVDLVTCYTGISGDVVNATVDVGARGLVIEAMSSAGVPRQLVPAIETAVAQGISVVVTSRCYASGIVRGTMNHQGIDGYSRELKELGVALTDLDGLKARCRLIALLASGTSNAQAVEAMNEIN